MTDVDPVTLEVIDNRFDEIVREMQHVMFRTGYSTIIRDSKDGSAGLCLPDGDVIGQAFQLPLHCTVFPPTVRGILERYDPGEIAAGDAFIVNDYYKSGAPHASDIFVATPVVYDDALRGFCLTVAHKPDIGGIVSGSVSPNSTEIFQDGLSLPPIRYRRDGEIDADIEAIIRNNSRTPTLTVGDIRGQLGCTNVGVELATDLLDEFGPETVDAVAERVLQSTADRIAEEVVDWDGSVELAGEFDVGAEELVHLSLEIRTEPGEGRLTFDFTGTQDQLRGPSNMPPHIVKAACFMAIAGIVDPSLPLNSGVERACAFVLPEGTVVNPNHPASVANYAKGLSDTIELVLRGLSTFKPEAAVAETGGKASITIGPSGPEGGKDVVHYELIGSGYGGHATGDGADCMATGYHSNVAFPSIEINETEFPERISAFSVLPDSGAPGAFRGGMGYVREYTVDAPREFTYIASNHSFGSHGVRGGHDSDLARAVLNPGRDDERELTGGETVDLAPGDVMRLERPGGAGFGDPLERDPERVLADVRDGFVTGEAAEREYGVVVERVDGRYEHDAAATEERRDGG